MYNKDKIGLNEGEQNLEGKVAWGGVEGELDADGVEDVAGEEGQPAHKERCWVGKIMNDLRKIRD